MLLSWRAACVVFVLSLVGCGGGGGGGTTTTAQNTAPTATIKAAGDVRAAAVGGGVDGTLGALVTLDASGSSDAEKDTLTFAWTVVEKPLGSTLSIAAPAASSLEFRPDQMGKYVLSVTVKDTSGASATQQLVVNINNTAPSASVVVTPRFTASPLVAAEVPMTVGGTVVLDASGSVDPDGDAVSVNFELTGRPAGSSAQLATSGAASRLNIDALGLYTLKLTGSDGRGGSFVSQYSFRAINLSPTAAVAVKPDFTAVPLMAPLQAMTLGATIALDATSSTDPDGDQVSVEYSLVSSPAANSARLLVNGKLASLQPDALGIYTVKVVGRDGRGGSFESQYGFRVDNRVPNPVVVTSITSGIASAGSRTMSASVGYDISLDGGASVDPDGDTLSHAWSLVSAPNGSTARLSSPTASAVVLTPDVMGNYVVMLTTTDPRGAASSYTLTVMVDNRRPVADFSSNATPQSLPSAPSMTLPLGTEVTFRGGNSTDADGDVLTYLWSVVSRPVGSTASLSSPSVVATSFTPDLEGTYVLKLRVTDSKAAFSEKVVTLNVGNRAPVAVLNRSRLMVLLGSAASVSAASSYDVDGDSKTYQWTLDAKPTGSTSAQLAATGAELSFTPDVAGTYVVTVSVSDGRLQSSASVEIKAMASLSNLVTLNFAPAQMFYSKGLDQAVTWANNSSNLILVDPFSGVLRTVPLSFPIKAAKLSPNGRLAGVLHEGVVSLVDLETATLVRQFSSAGSQSDIYITDTAGIYVDGGDQWSAALKVFDGNDGSQVVQTGTTGFGFFWGMMTGGVYSPKNNTLFAISNGLSPTDISYARINPLTNQIGQLGDSPYHGDYTMFGPLFLNDDEGLVFTSYGNYFATTDLHYVGALTGLTASMLGMSHHVASSELLAVTWAVGSGPYSSNGLATYYKRYTGSLFVPQNDVPMPTVGGNPSYAVKVFHSGGGRHVILAQTQTSELAGTGAVYHVIVR